jgi:hypothetical protein
MSTTDTIRKLDSSIVFYSLLSSIKLLAGDSFRDDKTPFIYSDGKRHIACLILPTSITLLYNE